MILYIYIHTHICIFVYPYVYVYLCPERGRHPLLVGPANCKHYSCNHVWSSESSHAQSISVQVLKRFVVTVAVVTVCWSCDLQGFRRQEVRQAASLRVHLAQSRSPQELVVVWIPCLRTDGVNTNGAAAKVMNFDGSGERVRPGTFGNIKAG